MLKLVQIVLPSGGLAAPKVGATGVEPAVHVHMVLQAEFVQP